MTFSHFSSLKTGEVPLVPLTSKAIQPLLPLMAHFQASPELENSMGPLLQDWKTLLSDEIWKPLSQLELFTKEDDIIHPWPNRKSFTDYLGVPTSPYLPNEPSLPWESTEPWGNPFRLECMKTLSAHLFFSQKPDAILIPDPSGEWIWGLGQVIQWTDVIPFRLFALIPSEQPQLAQAMEGQPCEIPNCPIATDSITDVISKSGGTCLVVDGTPEQQVEAAKTILHRSQFVDEDETLLIINTWET